MKKYKRNCFFLTFQDWPRSSDLVKEWISVEYCNSNNQNKVLHELAQQHSIDVIYTFMVWVDTIDTLWLEHILIINQVIFCWGYSPKAHINICISHALNYKIQRIHKSHISSHMVYFPFDSEKWSLLQPKLTKTELRWKYDIPDNLFLTWRVARSELTKRWRNFISNIKFILSNNNNIWLVLIWLPFLYKLFLLPFRKRIFYFPTTSNDKSLTEIYSLIDCYYHTAEVGETFWMVLAEAMYFWLPVISHSTHFEKDWNINIGIDNSQIELVENWVNWIISNDKYLIDKRIKMLQDDKQYLLKIQNENKLKVMKNYNKEIICSYLHDIILQGNNNNSVSSERIYINLLNKIDQSDIYKYDEYIYINIIKKIYSIVRYMLRKIWIDLEKYYINRRFR